MQDKDVTREMCLRSVGITSFQGEIPHLANALYNNNNSQGLQICGPKGRDCIEDNIVNTFNCITTCRGIYADVQWVGNNINEEMKDELPQRLVKTQLEEGRDDDLQIALGETF